MRHAVLLLLFSALLLLDSPAAATQIVVLDDGVELEDVSAIVRDVGDFRFAVLPDDVIVPQLEGMRRLQLRDGEDAFLVDVHSASAERSVFTSSRRLVEGKNFSIVAADAAQTRVLDTLSVCRERLIWIEPRDVDPRTALPGLARVDAEVKNEIVDGIVSSRYAQIVRELSGNIVFWLNDNLESTDNRYTHTAGTGDDIDIAAAYLQDRFEAAGYDVIRQPFQVNATTTDNIIAVKTGTTFPDEIITVGAHYDAISEDPSLRAPGAEDNGSGTAAVLQLAEVFADYETERTIHFVCFSGEEQGLYGSQYYVSQLGANGWNVINALTMDMISAWESNYKVIIEGQTPWESLMTVFEQNVVEYAQIASRKDYFSFGSDHVPFQDAGIPAFLAIDWDYGTYDHYHRTTDRWQYLDASLGHRITQAMAGALADLTNPSRVATDAPATRSAISLAPNFPNPFNPRTVIRFALDRESEISLRVYDLAGRHVQTIVDETLGAGPHLAQWDGTDLQGREVASGTYLLRLMRGEDVVSRRMSLVR